MTDLKCSTCNKQAVVKPIGTQFVVTCKRDGRACCETRRHSTEAEAVSGWAKLQEGRK